MNDIEKQELYDLIPPQHKNNNFINWTTELVKRIKDAAINLTSHFNVDTAVGNQLDTIGEIVGVSRYLPFNTKNTDGLVPGTANKLNDELYRIVIFAQIAKNTWDGTMPNVLELWEMLLPNRLLVVVDNLDMSIDVIVYGTATDLERELIDKLYFVPKPAGVRVNYYFPPDQPLFGFDRDDEYVAGYDKGVWAKGVK